MAQHIEKRIATMVIITVMKLRTIYLSRLKNISFIRKAPKNDNLQNCVKHASGEKKLNGKPKMNFKHFTNFTKERCRP